VVHSLIAIEADCMAKNMLGDTPLMTILRTSHYKAIAECLLSPSEVSGEPLSRADVCNLACETPLLLLANLGDANLASLMLRAGAVPGHTLPDGTSCLHIAARFGHFGFCTVILDWHRSKLDSISNADFRGSAIAHSYFLPVYRDPSGYTAAELARHAGFMELADLLKSAECRAHRENPWEGFVEE